MTLIVQKYILIRSTQINIVGENGNIIMTIMNYIYMCVCVCMSVCICAYVCVYACVRILFCKQNATETSTLDGHMKSGAIV